MANGTGYTLATDPQILAGSTATLHATLVGGTDLATPLIITPTSPEVAFAGPITISSGSATGSTTFISSGPDGPTAISASHTGGNTGMADPVAYTEQVSANYPPATGYAFSVHSIPSPYQGPWANTFPSADSPNGVGHIILCWLTGGWAIPTPVAITFADDASGYFLGNPYTLGGYPQFNLGSDGAAAGCIYWMPTAAGTRTLSATHTGGPPSFADPAPVTAAAAFTTPPLTGYVSPSSSAFPATPAYTVPSVSPVYPPATGYTVAVVAPAGCGGTGPVGTGVFVYIRLTGGPRLSTPLVVTLHDDAGGLFPDSPITLTGGDFGHQAAVSYYVPMAAGLRTITATHTGPAFADPAPGPLTQFIAV